MKEKELKISVLDEEESIYHYTSANALMNIIKTNEFWVTDAQYLNDYTEIVYIKEVIKEACNEIMHIEEKGELLYNKIMDSYISLEEMSPQYILSFSTNKDSITLWSEFSDFYGYNIEFNISDLRRKIFLDSKFYNYYVQEGQVIYNKQEQINIVKNEILDLWYIKKDEKEIDSTIEIIKKHNSDSIITKERLIPPMPLEKIFDKENENELKEYEPHFGAMAMVLYIYSPFLKRSCFKDEYEYRFIFSPKLCIEEEKKHPMYNGDVLFREKDSVIIPYIKVNLKYDYIKIPIKSIMVGSKNNSDLAVKGTNYYLEEHDYSKIDVVKSDITLRY